MTIKYYSRPRLVGHYEANIYIERYVCSVLFIEIEQARWQLLYFYDVADGRDLSKFIDPPSWTGQPFTFDGNADIKQREGDVEFGKKSIDLSLRPNGSLATISRSLPSTVSIGKTTFFKLC